MLNCNDLRRNLIEGYAHQIKYQLSKWRSLWYCMKTGDCRKFAMVQKNYLVNHAMLRTTSVEGVIVHDKVQHDEAFFLPTNSIVSP